MAKVNPFKCIRPNEQVAHRVAALPYDVYSREEACQVVAKEELSFLKIDRAETQFDSSVDTYDERVYAKAKEILNKMVVDGTFISDEEECYYIYELTMDGRMQTGIVACSSIDDYANNVIKKHENTRADKEADRIHHVDTCNAHTGPIFLAYRANEIIRKIVNKVKKENKIYSFISDDDISHQVWKIDNCKDIQAIKEAFEKIDSIYIADGHHRAASAVKVGFKRREENPNYKGDEEFNFFLSVLFADEELMIMPYNRVVKDLNGHSLEEFIVLISEKFSIVKLGKTPFEPEEKGTIGMYLNNEWYKLKVNKKIQSNDPVEGLDVSILQNHILSPILSIGDPRTDERIDFIGGIRGLVELERRCNLDMKIAFSMYPTSIQELFEVSDAGLLMPPKSTWFEPKLRSGLFIHKLT